MALTFPATPATNETYTDPNSVVWQYDGVKWNVITGSTKRAFNGAKVEVSTDFGVSNTPTAIQFATEVYDTGNYYSSANPTKIMIGENGFYRLNIQMLTGSPGSGNSYTITIRKNGVTTITTVLASTNQYAVYDETVQLANGDYIEVMVSEISGSGIIKASDSFVEVIQLGLASGTTQKSFSGARVGIASYVAMSSTATAVSWSATVYDQNSNAQGDTYFDALSDTRLTVGFDGYYRVKSVIEAGQGGGVDTYTVTLRKNGTTTLETSTASPGEIVSVDEIYNLANGDYIELVISDSLSAGRIEDTTYLEITRLGV